MVGAAGSQQLDQRKALEGVDGGDDQDVQGGGHDLRPLDLPEGLQLRGTVHLGGLDQRLVHVAERGDIQHDGLADGGREQDQDDAGQCVAGIAQPVDVLVKEAHRLAQIVEDAVVVVVHPLPHDGDGHRAGDDRQVEHAAEEAGGPLRQVYDGGGHPQRERAGDGHRDDDDDERIFERANEDGVTEQFFIVCQAHENIGTVHGGIEEAGHHAQHHGIDDEAQEEDQAGQQETVGGKGLAPYQRTAALRLFDRRFCSQEDHRSFRL